MPASEKPSDIIDSYTQLLRRSPAAPEIAAFSLSAHLRARDAARPCAVILSPHPDDECLTGALPLRLLREHNWQIVNVAVTLGSNVERREARKKELAKACAILGFECVLADAEGFSAVTKTTRDENAPAWRKMVSRIAEIFDHYQPQAIFLPHNHDLHPSHVGTNLLGIDALSAQPVEFTCSLVQTEYWHPLDQPNLMVGSNDSDVSQLLAGLACHAGEMARNPYDVRFPAWLIDNVRRGSERVGGKGVAAAPMDFGTLYRLGLWRASKFVPSALNRIVAAGEPVGDILTP